MGSAYFLPWAIERVRIERISSVPGVQVYTQPRGNYLLRQFVGDQVAGRVTAIHLDSPTIDDKWIRKIVGFKELEVLSVRSTSISDSAFSSLEQLPNLMSINFVDTRVTPLAARAFKKKMPHLTLLKINNAAL